MTRSPAAGSRVRYAGLGYALTVLLTGTNLATPLYAVYERVFRLSPLDVTLLVAVYAAAVVVALLICGPLSDTAGYRPVLVAGLAAAAAARPCWPRRRDRAGCSRAGRCRDWLWAPARGRSPPGWC